MQISADAETQFDQTGIDLWDVKLALGRQECVEKNIHKKCCDGVTLMNRNTSGRLGTLNIWERTKVARSRL